MLGLFVALVLARFSVGILQSTRRPFELILAIPEDSGCSVLSVRQTQHHKGLSEQLGNHVIEISRNTMTKLDRQVRIFAFDQEVLWSQARSICGNEIAPPGPTQIPIEHRQKFLKKPIDDDDWLTPAPPLHVERLVESGPSNNRVDLVFFADGCMYLLPLLSFSFILLRPVF
jgi:hypothetical protein